jgi:hypothetical protein
MFPSMQRISSDDRPDPNALFAMGIVFMRAGVALMVSGGPGMAGMRALGLVFMILGARHMREEADQD